MQVKRHPSSSKINQVEKRRETNENGKKITIFAAGPAWSLFYDVI